MVKVKGAGDVPKKATTGFEGLAGRVGISKWETSFRLTVARSLGMLEEQQGD